MEGRVKPGKESWKLLGLSRPGSGKTKVSSLNQASSCSINCVTFNRVYSFGRQENCMSNRNLLICSVEICWRYSGQVLQVANEYTHIVLWVFLLLYLHCFLWGLFQYNYILLKKLLHTIIDNLVIQVHRYACLMFQKELYLKFDKKCHFKHFLVIPYIW